MIVDLVFEARIASGVRLPAYLPVSISNGASAWDRKAEHDWHRNKLLDGHCIDPVGVLRVDSKISRRHGRDLTPRKELVREEFLTKAADVFEKKGFASTTIQDVAQALQLSRSALYHYFKSKDEILEALVLEHTEHAAEQMEQKFASRSESPSDQLRELLANSINGRMTGGPRLRVLDQLANEMPPEIKQKFDHGRRRVLDLYTRLIQKGIDAGELRPLDARTAAFAILGIASWTSWWYSPTGRKSPEELASVPVDVAFNGIAQPEGAAQGAPKPKELLRSLKRDIAQLERLIQEVDGT